jgi:hypothetical protein
MMSALISVIDGEIETGAAIAISAGLLYANVDCLTYQEEA